MSGDHAISVSRAALHELLTDAHVAIVEHRHDWAGAVLHTLRKLTAPGVAAPEGRARKLKDDVRLPDGLGLGSPSGAEAVPQPPTPEPAQAAGRSIARDSKLRAAHRPTSVWTEERTGKLREHWPTCMDVTALFEILNAMPGPPIASQAALRTKATEMDLRRTPETLEALARAAGHKGGKASVARTPTVDQGMRTPERMDLLRQLWADASLTVPMIHARICALPGPKPAASQVMYAWAKRLGLPTQRPVVSTTPAIDAEDPPEEEGAPIEEADDAEEGVPAEPEAQPVEPAPAAPPPEPAPPTAPAPIAPADEKAEAFDAFASGMTVRDVAADFGLPLSTLANWHAEWKLLTKTKAAAE